MNTFPNHTFAICAYKESEYLQQCIESIKSQKVKSNIIITTSTPNDFIRRHAEKYRIPLFVNSKQEGIGSDWNFAVRMSDTDYVTVAHQDDIYCNQYIEELKSAFLGNPNALIAFTDYRELQNNKPVRLSKLLKTKKLVLSPLQFFPNSKIIRKSILAFGTPICCPSVTLSRKLLGFDCFDTHLKSNLDWFSWKQIAKMDGSFLYIPKILVYHRIHSDSETNHLLRSDVRKNEDLMMLKKTWPVPIANILFYLYKNLFKAYNITNANQ